MNPIAIGPTTLDWPAWVQAIGSILAIIVAILVARQETLREKKRKQVDLLNFSQFLILRCKMNCDTLYHVSDQANETAPNDYISWGYYWQQLHSWSSVALNDLALFREMSLESWPDYVLAGFFHDFHSCVRNIASIAEQGFGSAYKNIEDELEFEESYQVVSAQNARMGFDMRINITKTLMKIVKYEQFLFEQAKKIGVHKRGELSDGLNATRLDAELETAEKFATSNEKATVGS